MILILLQNVSKLLLVSSCVILFVLIDSAFLSALIDFVLLIEYNRFSVIKCISVLLEHIYLQDYRHMKSYFLIDFYHKCTSYFL